MMKWLIGLKWQQELDRAVFGPHYCAASALKNSLNKNDLGIVLEKQRSQQRLSHLNFADDIALIDESE